MFPIIVPETHISGQNIIMFCGLMCFILQCDMTCVLAGNDGGEIVFLPHAVESKRPLP